jgi:hypothetical protein
VKLKKYRNWWGETLREEYERRINALEAHIQDLSLRFSNVENWIGRQTEPTDIRKLDEPYTQEELKGME